MKHSRVELSSPAMDADPRPLAFDRSTPIDAVVAAAGARGPGARARELAAALAQQRPLEDLAESVRRFGGDPGAIELLAHWAQEAVLRDSPVAQSAVVAQWWQGVEHALRELPLSLASVERGLARLCWRDGAGGSRGRATPHAPAHAPSERRGAGAEALEGERDLPAEAALAAAHFPGGRVYSLRAPLAGRHPDRALLFALDLEGLRGVARRKVRHYRVTPADAIAGIFVAAHGVMPIDGDDDAVSRLRTYRAVAALLGGAPHDAMARAEQRDWSWIRGFVPAGLVSLYECGLVVVSPDRARIGGFARWLSD